MNIKGNIEGKRGNKQSINEKNPDFLHQHHLN